MTRSPPSLTVSDPTQNFPTRWSLLSFLVGDGNDGSLLAWLLISKLRPTSSRFLWCKIRLSGQDLIGDLHLPPTSSYLSTCTSTSTSRVYLLPLRSTFCSPNEESVHCYFLVLCMNGIVHLPTCHFNLQNNYTPHFEVATPQATQKYST